MLLLPFPLTGGALILLPSALTRYSPNHCPVRHGLFSLWIIFHLRDLREQLEHSRRKNFFFISIRGQTFPLIISRCVAFCKINPVWVLVSPFIQKAQVFLQPKEFLFYYFFDYHFYSMLNFSPSGTLLLCIFYHLDLPLSLLFYC